MAYSHNYGRGRGRGGPPPPFGGRDRDFSSGNHRNPPPQNNQHRQHQPNFINTMTMRDDHDRMNRGDRKRPGSPPRQESPSQKRPVYDSRADNEYGRFGNGSFNGPQGHPGSMDYGYGQRDMQRGDDRQFSNMQDTRGQMNPGGGGSMLPLPPSNQAPLFPSSASASVPSGPPAAKPLRSILKKKTSAAEPGTQPPPQELPGRAPERPPAVQNQPPNRGHDKTRLPGMSSYLEHEDEDKFLYGEDISKQISAAMQKASSQGERGLGTWMHPSDLGRTSQQNVPVSSFSGGSSVVTTQPGGITALSDESMSTIQAALASLKQTQAPPSQSSLFPVSQPRQPDVMSALPNISNDLLSSLKLPSNLLSGLGIQQQPQQPSRNPQMDILSSLSSLQTSELLSTVNQLKASMGRQTSDLLPRASPASQLSESLLMSRLGAQQSTPVRDEPKKDETTNTIQNILQSIGFDFGMSKRMQELAREKEEREGKVKEKDICINQSASFLGGGLSGADLTAGLFKRKDTQHRKEKSESKETKKPEEKETAQKIESVLSSKRDSFDSKPPVVDPYAPYGHSGAYPPTTQAYPPTTQAYPVAGIPGHPMPHGYPPSGFPIGFPPPPGYFGAPPPHMMSHLTVPPGTERRESDGFDDYDDFDRSMNKRSRRRSRSSERSRSRSIRRGSTDRSPRRRGSLDRSPRLKSPGRGRSKSPQRRSRDRSPKRRVSPSPKRKRSLSPKRHGSRDRSPRRRDSKERRSSRDRDRRRSSRDRDRRPSSKDRTGARRNSRERDRRPSSRDRDRPPSSKETDKQRRGSSRDRKVGSDNLPPKPDSRDAPSRNESVDKKLPEDFKIQIGTNADSRRVLATNNIFEQPPKQPSPETTRIVLMPKTDQHIRKITVAPKSKTDEASKTKSIPTDLPPEVKAKLKQEHDERQKKLDNLEKEMEKLKKQQNEIMRKRQRQKDGHKDPLLTANSKLQEEITEQIRALRRAAEEPVDVKKYQKPEVKVESKGDVTSSNKQSPSSTKNYKFVDHRSHWCRCCNVVSNNILMMCKHLKSRPHQQKVDPYDRPWTIHSMKKNSENNPKGPITNLPLSGTEFVMSVDAFYCSLCNEFMGDIPSAEAHLNDVSHFNTYKAYLAKNPFYEKRYILEKTAKLSIKKEERDQEQKKEMDRTRQSNREKDAKIKEKERRWDKEVQDLSDSQPQERQRKPDSADIKLKLAGKKEEDKQYGKFTWKKDGKGVVSTTTKLVTDEEEIPLPPTNCPKPKLFLPDASEQHFPAPKVSQIEAELPKPFKSKGRNRKKTGNQLASAKDPPAVVIPTVIGRIPRGAKKATVLPSWTPVTRKIPGSTKVQPIPKSEQQSKTEAENPASLDEFLSTGQDKDKAVPVEFGPDLNLLSIPLPPSEPETQESQEEKEDLKMLGIDPESRAPLATPVAPPPVSQNLSLPDKKSSNMSATTASNMYGIYFDSKQNAEAAATNENNINVEAENSKLQEAKDNMDVVAMDIDSPAPVETVDATQDSQQDPVKETSTENKDDSIKNDDSDKKDDTDTKDKVDVQGSQEKLDTNKSIDEKDVQATVQATVQAEEKANTGSNTEQESKAEGVQNEETDSKENINADSKEIELPSEAEAETGDQNVVKLEAKGNNFDENADGNEDSNDSTIIMSLDHDNFMEGMTVIDDDDDHSDMEGMTVIDEHNDEDTADDTVGDAVITEDMEQELLTGTVDDKDLNETDLADALDQFTGTEDPPPGILDTVDNDRDDTNPKIISLPIDDSLQDIVAIEGGTTDAIPVAAIVSGIDNPLLVVAVDNVEDSLPESIGGGENVGLAVSLIDNFSEESDSNKCFDPCLADSVADETVSFVDGISVLEPSDPVEPAEDTICPEEFKGISLEMPGEQEDLDISDGQSLGSSIDMGSDFEVLDECEDEADIADG